MGWRGSSAGKRTQARGALTGPPCPSLPAPAPEPGRLGLCESGGPHWPAAVSLPAPSLRLPAPEGHRRLLLPQGTLSPTPSGLHPAPPRPHSSLQGALSCP